MSSKIIFQPLFLAYKSCQYHEEQFKVGNAKTFWCETTYQVLVKPFFLHEFL